MMFKRSNADPCLYTRWINDKLNVWISWIDNLITLRPKEDVMKNKEVFKKNFKVDNVGWMNEYVGCKVDVNRDDGVLKLTQPVLIQSLSNEFDLPNKDYNTPAEPKSVLRHSEDEEVLSAEREKMNIALE